YFLLLLRPLRYRRHRHSFPTRRSSDLLAAGTAFGSVAGDLAGIGVDTILGGVNNIVGSDFADTMLGRAVADVFDGRGGNDLLNGDRKSTRLNSSHWPISCARFCLTKKS